MLKIYTPKEWFQLFRCAEIIIEDDGLIYRGEDYYKNFRQAIGKIDYSVGYIYGEDYNRLSRVPIGSIRQDGAVTKIYGEDYARLTAQPILYIRDNRIYAADEFYKLFPMEAAYIDGSSGSSASYGSGAAVNVRSEEDEPKLSEHPVAKVIFGIWGAGFWGIIGIIFALAVVAFAFWYPFHVMSGGEGAEHARLLIMGLGFGAFMAFFTADNGEKMFEKMMLFTVLGIFAMDVYNTYKSGGITVGEVIVTALLGSIVYSLVVLVPCALLSFILWFIKKTFVKKNKLKNKTGRMEIK